VKRFVLPPAGADCLAGCTTVGPDYHLPDKAAMQRPAAQAGFANVDGKLTSAQPVASRWWQLYHDPVLNQLVEQHKPPIPICVLPAPICKKPGSGHRSECRSRPACCRIGIGRAGAVSGQSMLLEEPLPVTNLGDEGIRLLISWICLASSSAAKKPKPIPRPWLPRATWPASP
jgi:hypothetical protein